MPAGIGGAPAPIATKIPAPANIEDIFGSERARAVIAQFPSRGARSDKSIPPRSPQATVDSFKLMDGLKAEVVLHEPVITQPLFLNFAERGRLWVVEFGSDLSGYERSNLANMILNIVDPSLSLREGYATLQIDTKDRRTLVGFIDERDSNRIILRDPSGQRTPVPVDEIIREQAVPVSLMPEGLLEGLTTRELTDFFAYLASPSEPAAGQTQN